MKSMDLYLNSKRFPTDRCGLTTSHPAIDPPKNTDGPSEEAYLVLRPSIYPRPYPEPDLESTDPVHQLIQAVLTLLEGLINQALEEADAKQSLLPAKDIKIALRSARSDMSG